MKTRGKVLLLIVSALALVIATIFGTLAYLTDTETVENTFTVGHVDITLDEARVNDAGVPVNAKTDNDGNVEITKTYNNWATEGWIGADRVQANEYHLVPGHTYVKDPTVTVKTGSELAYVRMKVTVKNYDGLIKAIPYVEGSKYYGGYNNQNIFLLETLCGGWDRSTWVFTGFELSADGTSATYEFRYKDPVGAWGGNKTDMTLDALFDTITLPGDEIGNEQMDMLEGIEINVVAHAMQKDGFDTADAAWASWQDNGSYTIETE